MQHPGIVDLDDRSLRGRVRLDHAFCAHARVGVPQLVEDSRDRRSPDGRGGRAMSRARAVRDAYPKADRRAVTVSWRTNGASTGVTRTPCTPGWSAALRPARTKRADPAQRAALTQTAPGLPVAHFRSQLFVIGPADHDDVGDPAGSGGWHRVGRRNWVRRADGEESLGFSHATRLPRGENHPWNHDWILTRPNLHAFLDFHDGTPYTGRVFKLSVCWEAQHSGFIGEVDVGSRRRFPGGFRRAASSRPYFFPS